MRVTWMQLCTAGACVLATTTSAHILPDLTKGQRGAKFVGYLVSTFSDPVPKVQQYLSNGNDPLSYRKLNGGSPVLNSTVGTRAVRDIFVATNSARSEFFVIATDLDINAEGFSWDKATRTGSRGLVIWHSTDLINWSAPALRTIEAPTAGMAWAPSAVWDETTQQYYVFWASRHYSVSDTAHTGAANDDRIRYATTKDFVTFSAPKDYLAPGFPVIDQEFVYLGTPGHYVRFIKDERTLQVYQEKTTSGLFGTWTRLAGFVRNESPREGAVAFRDNVNSSLFHLWVDDYVQYIPYQTGDISNSAIWTPSDIKNFPSGLKHGSVLPLTRAEYARIAARYLQGE